MARALWKIFLNKTIVGDKRIIKNKYKQFILKLLYSLKLFWKYNEYMWIIKKTSTRNWRYSSRWKTTLRSRMYRYVIVYNFCHAHITKFCWNLVTLQLNSLNLLENRYHKNWILPECQGVFFYKNGYVFVLMCGISSHLGQCRLVFLCSTQKNIIFHWRNLCFFDH